jgi:hypothetical protein
MKTLENLHQDELKLGMSPGSPMAKQEGCTCPSVDNGYGEGSGNFDHEGNPLFWMNETCPLHGDTR